MCVYNLYVESKMEVPNSSLNLFLGAVEILSFIVTNCIEVFLELLKYGMRQHDTCKVSIHDPLHFSIFPTAVRLLSLLSFCIAFLPPFAPAWNCSPWSVERLCYLLRGFFWTFFWQLISTGVGGFWVFLDFDLSFFLNLAWVLSFFTKVPLSFSFQFMSQPKSLWNLQRIGW